jgi:hypothetical protein
MREKADGNREEQVNMPGNKLTWLLKSGKTNLKFPLELIE